MDPKDTGFGASDIIDLKFQEESTYFLTGEIEEENVNACAKWLIYENLNNHGKMCTLYINSQGGDLYQAFGLIDIMRNSRIPIRTIGYGSIMSSAFLIFASGTRGKRYIYRNTGIMCHQFSSTEDVGKYHDIKATRKEIDRLNDTMYNILKETTDVDGRIIRTKLLSASDFYMSADDMVNKYGAADHIL